MPGTKKKGKMAKSGRRKKRGPKEDVKSSTSLPPAVEGPLRCFLRVAITKVTWMTPKLPDATHVRLKWWGETSSGTLFRPVDGKTQGKAESQTVARFPIRCGPKQFAAYLNDMGSVTVDLLRGSSMAVAGRAQINEIGVISPQKPISGAYPVFSVKDSQKIAEVQIAMMFEPLINSYDSSSSLPTTDASMMAPSRATDQDSVYSKTSHRSTSSKSSKKKKSFPGSSSTEGPLTSANSKVHSDAISRDVESDYSSVIGHLSKPRTHDAVEVDPIHHMIPHDPRQDITRTPLSTLPLTHNTRPLPVPTHRMGNTVPERLNRDLISSLLDRGKKLRDAMIKEELGHQSTRARSRLVNQGMENGGTANVGEGQRRLERRGSTGELFREILHGDQDEVPVRDGEHTVAFGNQDDAEDGDTEDRAVELLVGDVLNAKDLKNLKALYSGSSPPASASSHSDDDYSEDEDPLHDNSILEELFYKGLPNSSSESLADLLDSDSNDEVESHQVKKTKNDRSQKTRSPRQKENNVDDLSSNGYLDTNAGADAMQMRIGTEIDVEESEESSQYLSESRTSGSLSLSSSRDTSHFQTGQSGPDPASGLSVERLTLLGRVHVARVTIDKLTLQSEPTSRIPVRVNKRADKEGYAGKGKPPRPLAQKKITYFIEYQFPVSEASSTARNGASVGAMATEMMRVVSKKVSGKEVSFGHRSVFPVQFDGQAVDRWWKQLLVFKVFSKVAGDKHPTILGVASIPLRSLIQSPDLVTISDLPVKDKNTSLTHTPADDSSQRGNMIGVISVSMELASDSKDFASALAKTRVAEVQGAKIVPLPSSDPNARLGHLTKHTPPPSSSSEQSGRRQPQDGGPLMNHPEPAAVISSNQPGNLNKLSEEAQTDRKTSTGLANGFEALTLHSLLYVRDGHVIPSVPVDSRTRPHPHPSLQTASVGRDRLVHNTYLVGRMFWLDDAARSDVCWGTTQPNFDYVQVSPVLLTQSLLERMRNNFTVIEVWDKKTSAQNDKLLGIAKLPLHQFYMSYRDQRIGKTLLKSQYPVVAVDNEVPITDPFTGQRCGQLTILLALGSQQQVSALQRMKFIRRDATDVPERPIYYGERADVHSADQEVEESGAVEHVFEMVIEGIQGLTQLEDSVWGEADCFIQYHFPHQQQQSQQQQEFGGLIQDSSLTLRAHRTPTTLCVPDPVFNDVCRHRIVLVQGTPVQRELLTACAGVGGHTGGIPFEVWCRFYYPNVRDQVIAKATLPLAKLCAMVTMQRRGEPSVQTFSLPLRTHQDEQQREENEAAPKLHDSGLLDVTVSYRQTVIKHRAQPSRDITARSDGPHVSLALTIYRACGLKSAAAYIARHVSGMQYPSQVGINSYMKIQLSFLAKDDVRVTRTIARSFCPEYNHHVELPCPLLLPPVEGEDNEVVSLAEALESADLTLQVWHQVPGLRSGDSERPHHIEDTQPRGGGGMIGHRVIAQTGDVLIGSTTIPLMKLLANRTGIEGWYPISLPPMGWDAAPLLSQPDPMSDIPDDTPQPHPKLLDRVAGGVELAVKFGHQGDRERVINAGRKVGWSPDSLLLEDAEQIWDDGIHDGGSITCLSCEVTIDVDSAWFPVQSSLRPGQTQLDPHTKAYIRYKFYDKGAVCSKLCYLDQTGDNQLCADLKHCHVLHAKQSQPFAWYLREEQLEVQLWLSYNSELTSDSKARPRQRDKLIGCTYIDLSPLCHQRVKRHRVSGVFPLFKPGSVDMGGACLRAHITMKVTSDPKPEVVHQPKRGPKDQEIVEEDVQPLDEILDSNEVKDKEEEQEKEDRQKNQPVWMTVIIERAMHLNDFTEQARIGSIPPSSYVTFQSAVGPSPATTPTIPSSNNPLWQYTRDVAISPQLLDNQSLIFKIWHQVSSKQDTTCDRVMGFTSVDLGPLLAGIRSLDGWYNIMDFSGQTLGQIKISITPKESLSPLRHSPKQRAMLGSTNSSNLFSRAPLPSPHYLIPLSSSHTRPGSLPSTHPAVRSLDHFQQHLDGVREFHGKLQDRLRSLHRMETESEPSDHGRQPTDLDLPMTEIQQSDFQSHLAERTPSSSYLLENFRKNMEELDQLHQRLKTKLSGGEPSTSSGPSTTAPPPKKASHHHGNRGKEIERSQFSSGVMHGGEQGGFGHFASRDADADHRTVHENNWNNNQHPPPSPPHHHHHHNSRPAIDEGDADERSDVREDDERTSNWSTEEDPSDEAMNEHNGRDRHSDFTGNVSANKEEESNRRKDAYHGEDEDEHTGGGGYDFQEDGDDVDDEDSMVYVRPLNDVSSAAFSNGINDDVISPTTSPPTGPPQTVPPSSHRDDQELVEQRLEIGQHHLRDDQKIRSSNSIDEQNVETRNAEEYDTFHSRFGHDVGHHANQNNDALHIGIGRDERQDSHPQQRTDNVLPTSFDETNRENLVNFPQGFGTDDLQGIDTHSDYTNSASHITRSRSSTSSNGSHEGRSSGRTRSNNRDDDDGDDDDDDLVEDGIVLTLNAQEAELQRRQLLLEEEEAKRSAAVRPKVHSKSASSTLPDFFLPPTDLEASMRALYNTVSGPTSHELSARDRAKFEAAQEMAQRLSSGSQQRSQGQGRTVLPFSFKQPTADQAKRIAKIFSTKF